MKVTPVRFLPGRVYGGDWHFSLNMVSRAACCDRNYYWRDTVPGFRPFQAPAPFTLYLCPADTPWSGHAILLMTRPGLQSCGFETHKWWLFNLPANLRTEWPPVVKGVLYEG